MGTTRLMKLTYEKLDMKNAEEVIVLMKTHWWYESTFYEKTQIEFKSEPRHWQAIFNQVNMIAVGGRNEEGELKSCYCSIVSPYMFNPDINSAACIGWYIDKDYRSPETIVQLLNEIDILCTENNVDIYSLSLPDGKHDRLIERLQTKDYFVQDINLIKVIK